MELSKRLASTALTYRDAYLFGGFVRDVVLRGAPARDVDVTFTNPDSLDHYVDVVRSMFPGTTTSTRSSRYGACNVVTTLHVRDDASEITVDCVLRTREQCPDFTCNSLKLTSDGDLSLWCPKSTCSFHKVRELQRGLDDVRAKRFAAFRIPSSYKGRRYNKACSKSIQRALKMVERGWTMYGGTRVGTVEVVRSSATGITAEQLNDKCSICHDAWNDTVVVGECGHVFHAKCLLEWLPKAEDETCPTCRRKRFLFAS
jgi:hypothetical protein